MTYSLTTPDEYGVNHAVLTFDSPNDAREYLLALLSTTDDEPAPPSQASWAPLREPPAPWSVRDGRSPWSVRDQSATGCTDPL
jgi:hypothetical protein